MEHLILVDAKDVSFFAYPGKQSSLVANGCQVHELSPPTADVLRSLGELVEALGAADARPQVLERAVPPRPDGPLTADTVCQVIGTILPEGAVFSDEGSRQSPAMRTAPST